MHRQRALYLAGAALWLASACAASAQPADPSHVLLPGGLGDRAAFEDELVNRLNRARDLAASERLFKKILENPDALGLKREELAKWAGNIAADLAKDPERFGIPTEQRKKLIEQIKQNKLPDKEQLEALEKIARGVNPNDPAMKALLRKLEQKQKLPKQDKEDLTAARRVLGPFDPSPVGPPPGGMRPPDGQPPVNPDQTVPNHPVPPPDTMPPTPPPVPQSPPQAQGTSAPEQGNNPSWLSRQLGKLRGSTGLGGNFRGLFRGLLGDRTRLGKFGRGLSSQTQQLRSKFLPSFGGVKLKGFMGGLGKVVPRNVKITPPSSRNLSPRTGLSGVSAGGLGTGLVVVLVLVAAGIGAWLVWTGRRWVRGEAGWAWRLGAWPVAPSAVQTRGDVVKAFEYLALLLLGRRAVPANHLEIAGQLGTSADDPSGRRRLAASELGDLYEHARYAPPDEQLSPDEVASARRDLSLLAGGSAA